MMNEMIGIRKKVAARVGMQSLIGVGPHRPTSWGNYFWLIGDTEARVANFWAENLKTARERFLEDGLVEIVEWKMPHDKYVIVFAIIDDARIPADWYYDKLCFTGGWRPSLEIAKEMYAIRNYPDAESELEEWTDPVSYYAKRGGVYNPATGIIRFTIRSE
jgi:hypothetical protein